MYFFIFELFLLFQIFKSGIKVILELLKDDRVQVEIDMVQEEIASQISISHTLMYFYP